MKYMGSKRAMLKNGLGHLLDETLMGRQRFVDLFCGSGAVSSFVAQRAAVPVLASDLQKYAVTLTNAVIERTESFNTDAHWSAWVERTEQWLKGNAVDFESASWICDKRPEQLNRVIQTRANCESLSQQHPITKAYGGYYYSAHQALTIDALRKTLPTQHAVPALAALVAAASRCAAAPGHTAQPFSTTDSSLPHLMHAWQKDVLKETKTAFDLFAGYRSQVKGNAVVQDAFSLTEELHEGDLVFVDPPYSEVQYSRFYHVLEAVAQGSVSEVSGTGRYPPLSDRPQSNYCLKTLVIDEFDRLMLGIALSGAEAIVTFPAGESSNGLSGLIVEELSNQYFSVKTKKVASVFSTLGGNRTSRAARQNTTELILHLVPK